MAFLSASNSSNDAFAAPRLENAERVDVELIFRSLDIALGTSNASFSGMHVERLGDLGGRGGGTNSTGSATNCLPAICASRGAVDTASD